ncbi:MAG: hypothetical protein AB1742_01495, partial [bacterium]
LFAAHAMEGTGAPARLARAALPVAIASALAENRFLAAAARNHRLAHSGDPNPVLEGMRLPALLALAAAVLFILALLPSLSRRPTLRPDPRSAAVRVALASLAVLSLLLCAAALLTRYPDYKYHYYTGFHVGEAWLAFHRLETAPATVAFTGTDLSYGLFGKGLKNHVAYVNVAGRADWKFHHFIQRMKKTGTYYPPRNDRIDFHRRDPDYRAWLRNLRRARAGWLFVSILHQTDRPYLEHDPLGFPIERAWAENHPETFTRVYENPAVAIFRIAPAENQGKRNCLLK